MILNPVDFKNFLYCPRQIYFKYVMCIATEETEKMKKGRMMHEIYLYLEKRRGFSKYKIDGLKKEFNVKVFSEKLGLSGEIDMIIEGEKDIIPVDFKMIDVGYLEGYSLQLYAYGLILREKYMKKADYGFLVFVNSSKLKRIDFDNEVAEKYENTLLEIKKIINEEIFPQGRKDGCADCEYINFCGDRW